LLTSFEPMSPVPPMTTIFMGSPSVACTSRTGQPDVS
jgi:hypothetical protein